MFDFLKDAVMEYRGIDVEEAHKQDQQKPRVFVPVFVKRIVYVLGGLYAAGALSGIVLMLTLGTTGIAKLSVLLCVDIASIVLLALKRKRTEIAGLVCVVVFFILMMV